MNKFDINCLIGHWPFRRIDKGTLEGIRKIHAETGITGGYVSSLNSIFYNDPFEGDEELHEIIKGTEYQHILTVNPTFPAIAEDIQKGIDQFDIKGVKIYPGYHQYRLDSTHVDNLCDILKSHDIPLFINMRMEDERLNYLIQPVAPIKAELEKLISSHPDNKIVLLSIRSGELNGLYDAITKHGNVYFDTSGLKESLFVIEKLLQTFSPEKMIYGSQYPLNVLKSTLFLVEKAEISDEVKEVIFCKHMI